MSFLPIMHHPLQTAGQVKKQHSRQLGTALLPSTAPSAACHRHQPVPLPYNKATPSDKTLLPSPAPHPPDALQVKQVLARQLHRAQPAAAAAAAGARRPIAQLAAAYSAVAHLHKQRPRSTGGP